MVSLSVYIAICQFNNLWLFAGAFPVRVGVFPSRGEIRLLETVMFCH